MPAPGTTKTTDPAVRKHRGAGSCGGSEDGGGHRGEHRGGDDALDDGIVVSAGCSPAVRTDRCVLDNAVAETFFAALKTRCITEPHSPPAFAHGSPWLTTSRCSTTAAGCTRRCTAPQPPLLDQQPEE